jgi:hypothetical protein
MLIGSLPDFAQLVAWHAKASRATCAAPQHWLYLAPQNAKIAVRSEGYAKVFAAAYGRAVLESP